MFGVRSTWHKPAGAASCAAYTEAYRPQSSAKKNRMFGR
jgi:hypothetical protein